MITQLILIPATVVCAAAPPDLTTIANYLANTYSEHRMRMFES